MNKHFASVLALLAFSFLATGTSDNGSSSSEPREPDVHDAWVFCQYAVKSRLKAPSTAKFKFGGAGSDVAALGNGRFRVKSWVDAQNSFGAMMRSQFDCVVKFPEKKLEVLEID